MRWTRAQRATEATNLDAGAAAKLAGAANGDQAASNPALSSTERRIGAAAATALRDQAKDMRETAAALRDGVNPTDLGYTGSPR